jgi:DNA invertase Pin-like site-specific DNA recombinase
MFKTLIYVRKNGTEPELSTLRHIVESRGNTVVATFRDDPAILGKGRFKNWRRVTASLDQADKVVVGSAADLPGRSVADLLKILDLLREHDVGLVIHRERINTDDGPAAILDLIASYRAAKLSEAIRRGIAKAKDRGKILGRPAVPDHVREQIQTALANGAGIRPTARRHKVSPATVINIKRSMEVEGERLAA